MSWQILQGDARHIPLADNSVHCCVTSPPFYGLRSYLPTQHEDKDKEIGLEQSIAVYIQTLLAVFAEVWRVLRDDGTCWVEIGDSYWGSWGNYSGQNRGNGKQRTIANGSAVPNPAYDGLEKFRRPTAYTSSIGLKPKDKCLIPFRFAIAMQEAGWYVRQDCIWHHVNAMPESCQDRPTTAHSYVFLLAKSPRYFYDNEAIKERSVTKDPRRPYTSLGAKQLDGRESWHSGERRNGEDFSTRNARSVWVIPSEGSDLQHFAMMPTELAKRCIKAGTSEKGCCQGCGIPWVRLVDRTLTQPGVTGGKTPYDRHRPDGFNLRAGGFGGGVSHTLSWQPSCSCDAGPPIPCTVFDPFGGPGTTALVADRLGRHAISLELSRDTCLMAKERIGGEVPLFAAVAVAAAVNEQGGLF